VIFYFHEGICSAFDFYTQYQRAIVISNHSSTHHFANAWTFWFISSFSYLSARQQKQQKNTSGKGLLCSKKESRSEKKGTQEALRDWAW